MAMPRIALADVSPRLGRSQRFCGSARKRYRANLPHRASKVVEFRLQCGPKNRLIGAGNKFSAVWSSHLRPVGFRPGGKQIDAYHFRESRARIRLRTRGRCQRMAGPGGLVASKGHQCQFPHAGAARDWRSRIRSTRIRLDLFRACQWKRED